MRQLLIVLLALSPTTASAANIVGRASVIDADTLEITGARIRLSGIDAPDPSQLCRGKDSLHYRCGSKAANDLDAMLKDHVVTCTPVAADRYNRTVAVCTVNGTDMRVDDRARLSA